MIHSLIATYRIIRRVIKKAPRRPASTRTRTEYLRFKESARVLIHHRLEYFNAHYKLTNGRVSIKNQRTKWGSCSSKGNLNFSYRIMKLPPELQDYLIVHELCHLAELNHGPKFWALVAETIPDYKKAHTLLRTGVFK